MPTAGSTVGVAGSNALLDFKAALELLVGLTAHGCWKADAIQVRLPAQDPKGWCTLSELAASPRGRL